LKKGNGKKQNKKKNGVSKEVGMGNLSVKRNPNLMQSKAKWRLGGEKSGNHGGNWGEKKNRTTGDRKVGANTLGRNTLLGGRTAYNG